MENVHGGQHTSSAMHETEIGKVCLMPLCVRHVLAVSGVCQVSNSVSYVCDPAERVRPADVMIHGGHDCFRRVRFLHGLFSLAVAPDDVHVGAVCQCMDACICAAAKLDWLVLQRMPW